MSNDAADSEPPDVDDLQEQIDENTEQIARLCDLLGQVTESIDALAESNRPTTDTDIDAGEREVGPDADPSLPFYQ